MIAREEKRLRALFVALASASFGAAASGCSAADDGGPSDGSAEDARDGTTGEPIADASSDATLAASDAGSIVDGGHDAACDPSFLDGADDGSGCDYFESLACGLPPDSSTLDCYLYLPECATICGSPFAYPCIVVGCGADGGIPSGPLTIECTTGKVSCPDAGRRPAGLVDAKPARAENALGVWLAEVAWLEAASVCAFRRLASELASLRAPRVFVQIALRSARDEVRHARVMSRLARRRGVTPASVHVKKRGARSLAAFALENAVEGCVRESFGALVATWQARHAPDADVARAMNGIAIDETRHAALAWSVARWLEPQLDTETRARVSSATHSAVAALRCEMRHAPSALARAAGLPHGKAGADLVAAFAEALALA